MRGMYSKLTTRVAAGCVVALAGLAVSTGSAGASAPANPPLVPAARAGLLPQGLGPPGAAWAGYLYENINAKSFYASFGVPRVVCAARGATIVYGAALQAGKIAVAANIIANCKPNHVVLYEARVTTGKEVNSTYTYRYRFTSHRPRPGQRVGIYLSISGTTAWAHIQDGQMAPALEVQGPTGKAQLEVGAWFAKSNQGVSTVSKSTWTKVAVNHILTPGFKGVGPGDIYKGKKEWLKATKIVKGTFTIERP